MRTTPQESAIQRADEALEQRRAMYRRVLASWASDLLALRARGLDRPVRRVAGAGARVRRAA